MNHWGLSLGWNGCIELNWDKHLELVAMANDGRVGWTHFHVLWGTQVSVPYIFMNAKDHVYQKSLLLGHHEQTAPMEYH